jgi:NAD(P)-dependent dehydrogenase (short-subunit alcohol dehydrogenase family)
MSPRYVFITGASKGIGRATALRLDRAGFHVFAGIRNPKDGDALCEEASQRLHPVIIDVLNAQQIADAVTLVQKVTGSRGLYGLINNAGIATPAPLEFMPLDEFRHQIEVNLTAPLAVTQAFLPAVRQARGRIINLSSIGGKVAGTMIGAYHATKFAIEAMSDTLRQELKPWGIEVVSIEPGAIVTPMWETATGTADRLLETMPKQALDYYGGEIERVKRSSKAVVEQRGIPPERVAAVIEKALTVRRPHTRYPVGTDAWIGVNILALLPDRMRDLVMARLL